MQVDFDEVNMCTKFCKRGLSVLEILLILFACVHALFNYCIALYFGDYPIKM